MSLHVQSIKTDIAIPVSTRGVGFSVVDIFRELEDLASKNTPKEVNIYQMYRTSLGYFESKMLYNRRPSLAKYETYNFHVNVKMMESFSYGRVPDPLSIVINAMAPVEVGDTRFSPILSPDKMEGNLFMPSPERVTYSNLRKTVEALSNEQVPAEIRADFYRNNPIPGAIWHGEPSNPILQNGDEIMPKDYTYKELYNDLRMVNRVYCFLGRQQNYFNYPLDHKARGSTALFVCNEMGDLKIVDRNVGEELNAYQQRISVQGDVTRYWNIRNVAPADQSLGCYILAGEVPSFPRFKYPNYVVRDKPNAEQTAYISYRSISLRHLIQNPVINKYGVKSIAIPVSTRAIGFNVVDVFQKLQLWAYKIPPKTVNIYQMYRTSLGYFESKMMKNRRQFPVDFETYQFPMDTDLMQVCSYGQVPDPLSIVINAIAPVKVRGTNYYPIFLPDNMVENVFMPSPERVTFSNLRKTVEALSNEQVPAEIRAAFYYNNPIPGAIWNGEPYNPILQNGDEIMPKDYTFSELCNDLMRVRGIYDFLLHKEQNSFNCPLDRDALGSTALFVCNEMGDLKIVDRNVGEDLNAYQQRIKVQGNVKEYWNIRNVAPADQSLGCYILAGEVPRTKSVLKEDEEVPILKRFRYPNYVVRDERCAVQWANESYTCARSKIFF